MWSTPLAQKGFLRICAQTRRDLSLVYNNPQWRIQGRDPGGGAGHPLLLDQSEARSYKTDRHSHDYEGQESSKLHNTRK